jgi:hypothetical protein
MGGSANSRLGSIVTKVGIWLMPKPPVYRVRFPFANPSNYASPHVLRKVFCITFENENDLPKIIDIIRPLRINMVLQNVPTLRNAIMDIACVKPKLHWTNNEDDPLSTERIHEICKELKMGFWNL